MALFKKPQYSTVAVKKKDIPKGLWTKCPKSGEIVYNKELEENCYVVPKSGYHFQMDAPKRIEMLLDSDSFEEKDAGLTSVDPLSFVDKVPYPARISKYQKATGMPDALVSGTGTIESIPVSIAVMDFRFSAASMGSVVGEKITRATERATAEGRALLIVSASGGARMQEGVFSLMQMAKTSAALVKHSEAGLPFISILTHPTTGGVTASFATLGDLIIAEPAAQICFAGPRVIKDTTKQDLPEGFQTAEFLLEHGLIDQIVDRRDMRDRIASFLKALCSKQIPA